MQIFYILILNLPDDEPLSKVRNDRREMLGIKLLQTHRYIHICFLYENLLLVSLIL